MGYRDTRPGERGWDTDYYRRTDSAGYIAPGQATDSGQPLERRTDYDSGTTEIAPRRSVVEVASVGEKYYPPQEATISSSSIYPGPTEQTFEPWPADEIVTIDDPPVVIPDEPIKTIPPILSHPTTTPAPAPEASGGSVSYAGYSSAGYGKREFPPVEPIDFVSVEIPSTPSTGPAKKMTGNQKLLLWGAIGLGAYLLLRKKS